MFRKIILNLSVVAVFLASCGGKGGPASDLKIVGGVTTTLAENPWQVSLQRRETPESPFVPYCGGALISERKVLTAAHCFNFVESYENHIVRFGGDGSLSGFAGTAEVQSVAKHPEFSYGLNDIAVITLASPIEEMSVPNVAPIAVFLADAPAPWTEVTVTGWGAVKIRLKDDGYYEMENPQNLQEASLTVLPSAADSFWTEANFKTYFPDPNGMQKVQRESFVQGNTIALFGESSRGACRGDSGGPAVMMKDRPVLIGVTSQGTDSATCKLVSLYTSVYAARDWLRDFID